MPCCLVIFTVCLLPKRDGGKCYFSAPKSRPEASLLSPPSLRFLTGLLSPRSAHIHLFSRQQIKKIVLNQRRLLILCLIAFFGFLRMFQIKPELLSGLAPSAFPHESAFPSSPSVQQPAWAYPPPVWTGSSFVE